MPPPPDLSLAQLSDIMSISAWNTFFAAGLLAPLIGTLLSLAIRTATRPKLQAVALYYALSLPLAAMTYLLQTENVGAICGFILLMPIGMILGLAVLIPTRRRALTPRGFEVQPQRDPKST